MRVVVQRVKQAIVSVDNSDISNIGKGLLVFLGIGKNDGQEDADYLADKIINLRIFSSEKSDIDVSINDKPEYSILVVSQFTLFGDCRKGRRPSFSNAASSEWANELYEYFIEKLINSGIKVKSGKFRAMMDVKLNNWGPVTILLDSKREF